ncbi:hypothetical protein AB0C29_02450 [Actinoplanes sp. NPDC048791]
MAASYAAETPSPGLTGRAPAATPLPGSAEMGDTGTGLEPAGCESP